MTHRLFICETCLDEAGATPGPDLAEAVRGKVAEDVEVVLTPCMNICDEPVSLALRAPGKMAYLFAGVKAGDEADIVALTELYRAAEDGIIEDARPAGRLRFCLKGRVPG